LGFEEGADERPPSMPDQIRGASAAARRAEQAGEISSHQVDRYREKLRELGDRFFRRRWRY